MLKNWSEEIIGVRGATGPSSAEESEVPHSFTDSDKHLSSSSDANGLGGGEAGNTYFSSMSPLCVSVVSLISGRSAGEKQEPPFSSGKTKTNIHSSCPVLSERIHGTFPSHTSHCSNTPPSPAVHCTVCFTAVIHVRLCM